MCENLALYDALRYSLSPCTQFMQDASEIMDVLVKAQATQGDMEPDDPQVTKNFIQSVTKMFGCTIKFFYSVTIFFMNRKKYFLSVTNFLIHCKYFQ